MSVKAMTGWIFLPSMLYMPDSSKIVLTTWYICIYIYVHEYVHFLPYYCNKVQQIKVTPAH